ncbi:hypothetical protein SLE2022_137080 [Rubroshorea leprosula]
MNRHSFSLWSEACLPSSSNSSSSSAVLDGDDKQGIAIALSFALEHSDLLTSSGEQGIRTSWQSDEGAWQQLS